MSLVPNACSKYVSSRKAAAWQFFPSGFHAVGGKHCQVITQEFCMLFSKRIKEVITQESLSIKIKVVMSQKQKCIDAEGYSEVHQVQDIISL